MSKLYFVDTTGTGEGYIIEAHFVRVDAGVAVFSDEHNIPTLIETEFYNIELVTAEDVEYTETEESETPVEHVD